MSSINPASNNNPINRITRNPIQRSTPAAAPSRAPASDRLELSSAGHLLQTLKSNDVRLDKVAQVRAQLDAGTYETDAKFDIAADRLLDDLA